MLPPGCHQVFLAQKWQKAVCRDVNMGEEEMKRFWEAQKGKQIAWRILNCRRNNAMNSMKAKFEGELALLSVLANVMCAS